MNEEKTKYNGFFMNIIFYTLAGIVASLCPVIIRTVVSLFLYTPSLSELKGDASYLFNVVYPIMGLMTTAAFIGGAFLCSYFTADKIAYKSREPFPHRKAKFQMAISAFLVLVFNVWYIFPSNYSGAFGCQYWYFSASLAPLFGIVDKRDAISFMSNSDALSNFIINGLTNYILGIILASFVLLAVGFGFASYYGRRLGHERGFASINKYLDELHSK